MNKAAENAVKQQSEIILPRIIQPLVIARTIVNSRSANITTYNAETGEAQTNGTQSMRMVGEVPVATDRSQAISKAFISKTGC